MKKILIIDSDVEQVSHYKSILADNPELAEELANKIKNATYLLKKNMNFHTIYIILRAKKINNHFYYILISKLNIISKRHFFVT